MTSLPEDPTLDEIRAALAPLLPRHAAFDGWRPAAVVSAARQLGVDPEIAALAFADGPVAMIDAWFASVDSRMLEALPPETLAAMRTGERVGALVWARIDLLAHDREALRRALTILALPTNVATAAKLGWRAADVMWRAAGDTATDYNHYSKRTILAGIYAATMLVLLNDDSEGQADTRTFLDRRLAGVARFEKAKAGFAARHENRLSLSRFIGRLRYPAI